MKHWFRKTLTAAAVAATPWLVHAQGMMSHPMPANNAAPAMAAEDTRPLVNLKPETIALLRADMRGMLAGLTNVLALLAEGKKKEAAALLESELGMAAMGSHPGMMKASQELPENVRMLGMEMHKAASKLAKNMDSMKPAAIYGGLSEISAGCVSCHMAYRVR